MSNHSKIKNTQPLPLRFYVISAFFLLLFLFYPGNAFYYQTFAFHEDAFRVSQSPNIPSIGPIPSLKVPSSPNVTAEGVYVVDLPTFTPIYEKNPHKELYPASTTKIITALVAYDLYDPTEVITVKRASAEGQIMGLRKDERITVENLLYGILVHSANDGAYALADHAGYDTFITQMNEKAEELHMKESTFTNPAGLDTGSPTSSPFDLALAGRELLQNPYLKKMTATKQITISDEDFKYFHNLSNINQLLGEIQGLGGLKTGYTELAGQNLVSFYKKSGHQFIIVVMKSEDRFEDTRNIIQWINQNVVYTQVEIN
jgi:D-alanyl-D-alanine carboxypeptidase